MSKREINLFVYDIKASVEAILDFEIIWNVIEQKLPLLNKVTNKMLKELGE